MAGHEELSESVGEVLLPKEKIHERIGGLATEIFADYPEGDVVFVCLLTGGVKFSVELVSSLVRLKPDYNPRLLFMDVRSYRDRESEKLSILQDLKYGEVKGQKTMILDDVGDTYGTLTGVKSHLLNFHGAASVETCVLVDKPEADKVGEPPDRIGFLIPNVWVKGWGMDNGDGNSFRYLDDVVAD